MLKSIEIYGYRGFASPQVLRLAQPRAGVPGSGLTVLVGPNNCGKSTVVESLEWLTRNNSVFSEGKRNHNAGDRVSLTLTLSDNSVHTLRTDESGGSETLRSPSNPAEFPKMLVIPPRRHFRAFFGKGGLAERHDYARRWDGESTRNQGIDGFTGRLFRIANNRSAFDQLLGRVLTPLPQWQLEHADHGQYYIKFNVNGLTHSSDGAGDGLLSVFVLIDALYDSTADELIVVDEPELSLHPAVQRRLADVLLDYSQSRQIVLATHSPYFVPMDAIGTGMTVARVFVTPSGSRISQLNTETARRMGTALADLNNPHVYGLDAREAFFLEDEIILVEGQEDVVFYRRMAQQMGIPFRGTFFGWGVGGAEKMSLVATMLKELGFQKVVGIVDANKADIAASLRAEHPEYSFCVLPTDDIRSKREVPARKAVEGMLLHDGALRVDQRQNAGRLIADVNGHLSAG